MKEFIVDFELYENGEVVGWMQNAFTLQDDDIEEGEPFDSLFEYFMRYAENFWNVDSSTPIRITKVWTLTV